MITPMTYLQRLLMALGIILLAPACTTTKYLPGETVEVRTAVPIPCKPVEVEQPELPQADIRMGIFELAKVALAKAEILEGYAERLRAANKNPCPELEE